MKAVRHFCYSTPAGEDIYLFVLRNANGTEVSITNFGAIITSLKVMRQRALTDLVLGFENVADYSAPAYLASYAWLGAAIGRYANRIKDAQFRIDGLTYALSKNLGNDQLHGGHGFDRKLWSVLRYDETSLELQYISRDGEEGYPGNLEVTLQFKLSAADDLFIEYKATTDKATAVNLSHHSYFNFNNGSGTILDHEVKIHAGQILEQDENLVATGQYRDIRLTPLDIREWKKIRDGLAPLDITYVTGTQSIPDPALVAEASSNGIHLEVWSTEPAVHFYTGQWIPSVKGKYGIWYQPYSGFCLETQVHPNAINIPSFPQTVLRPGETYRTRTIYRINY